MRCGTIFRKSSFQPNWKMAI
ncbi:BgTH12-02516 [Blumeria graminis f. sp. triticale]|uniref:BgTH12-02516 n=1 Tax=Blumeria graminis f. sp. triticale TaxID=1689686 RepID=A0A9W4D0W5_BLUGR|nr:BgTH12-02516 [Blumeria graminis f. sp. triticale]